MTADLENMSKNSSHKYNKAIAISKDKCFNCHKMCHFGQEYKFPNYYIKKKSSKSGSNIKQDWENNLFKPRPQWRNAATNVADNNNSNLKFFCFRKVFITMKSPTILQTRLILYLNLCASYNLTNNQSFFVGKINLKM